MTCNNCEWVFSPSISTGTAGTIVEKICKECGKIETVEGSALQVGTGDFYTIKRKFEYSEASLGEVSGKKKPKKKTPEPKAETKKEKPKVEVKQEPTPEVKPEEPKVEEKKEEPVKMAEPTDLVKDDMEIVPVDLNISAESKTTPEVKPEEKPEVNEDEDLELALLDGDGDSKGTEVKGVVLE